VAVGHESGVAYPVDPAMIQLLKKISLKPFEDDTPPLMPPLDSDRYYSKS